MTPVPSALAAWICYVFYIYETAGSIIIYNIPMSYATVTLTPEQLLSQLKLKPTQDTATPEILQFQLL